MLAILGGNRTGGKGLALRLARAGEEVIIGSRDAERAAAVAEELRQLAPSSGITGADNAGAAAQAGLVLVTVPYEGQRPLLEQLRGTLAGKVVVTVTSPMSSSEGAAPVR